MDGKSKKREVPLGTRKRKPRNPHILRLVRIAESGSLLHTVVHIYQSMQHLDGIGLILHNNDNTSEICAIIWMVISYSYHGYSVNDM